MRSNCALAVVAALVFTAPLSVSAQESGRVYVYSQRLSAAGSWLPISCGGVVVAELKRGKLFAINVPPGRHTLRVQAGLPAFVDVRPGEDLFVRLDWNYEVGRPAIPTLNPVRPDRARKEMLYLSYVDANRIRSSAVPKADPRQTPPLEFQKRHDQ